MADIVMADDGIEFDGDSLASGPLGGAETAFVSLANALAAKGHRVRVFNKCNRRIQRNGVEWVPLSSGTPNICDLYIANRSDKLLLLVKNARNAVFWIHNPANYLLKFRYLWKLWHRSPTIVFSGNYHARTYPCWAPDGGRRTIPYGISDEFLSVSRNDVLPLPRAVFTSNPLRGLDPLLDIWQKRIRPECPTAELHLFTGAKTYGAHGVARLEKIKPILDKAATMASEGVILKEPVAKEELANELSNARLLLYRGDPGETFCLAVGEAQAVGVPAVVMNVGCIPERVINGQSGFVTDDDESFAEHAVLLLNDDSLWLEQSSVSLSSQRRWTWELAADKFEEFID